MFNAELKINAVVAEVDRQIRASLKEIRLRGPLRWADRKLLQMSWQRRRRLQQMRRTLAALPPPRQIRYLLFYGFIERDEAIAAQRDAAGRIR
jgi:hypothetical protein